MTIIIEHYPGRLAATAALISRALERLISRALAVNTAGRGWGSLIAACPRRDSLFSSRAEHENPPLTFTSLFLRHFISATVNGGVPTGVIYNAAPSANKGANL